MVDPIKTVLDYVERHGQPACVSLSDNTHVFHFSDTSQYRDSPILLVNRNGNHFRLINNGKGYWTYAKTWANLFEVAAWHKVPNMDRADVSIAISLASIGPQYHGPAFETVCLLPRDATYKKRVAVWREHTLSVFFRPRDSFDLTTKSGATFHGNGKLWESRDASSWCLGIFGTHSGDNVIRPAFATPQPVPQELETSPLWGMF